MVSKWILPDGTRVRCNFSGCLRDVDASGLCNMHFKRVLRDRSRERGRNVDPDTGRVFECSVPGCEGSSKSSGMCQKHYDRLRRTGTLDFDPRYRGCPIPGCSRRMQSKAVTCGACGLKSAKYGLSKAQYLDLHAPGSFKCGNTGCRSTERLHLDHDHKCCPPGKFGKKHVVACGGCFRGWLCRRCNIALGILQEDKGRIAGLLDYIT